MEGGLRPPLHFFPKIKFAFSCKINFVKFAKNCHAQSGVTVSQGPIRKYLAFSLPHLHLVVPPWDHSSIGLGMS